MSLLRKFRDAGIEIKLNICEAQTKGGISVMNESLRFFKAEASGVYRVIQIANKKPYVAITASRHERTPQENKKVNINLLADIKEKGLYSYDMIGVYNECPKDKPNCPESEQVQVVEDSFFVPYSEKHMSLQEFIDFFVSLRDKYNQNSVLIGLPEAYNYEQPSYKAGDHELKTGRHYGVFEEKLEDWGSKATPKTIDKFGSIAIDPHKNRIIDWLTVGTLHPDGCNSRRSYDRAGLCWVEGLATNLTEPVNERTKQILEEKGRLKK